MATITAQQITQAGIKPTTVVPVVTTVVDPQLGTLKKENAVLSLAAGEQGFLGPFETAAFNDTDGNIKITCSATASVKLAALYL